MVTHDGSQFERLWLDSQFVGNHPALDFVNTLSHRLDPTVCEERLGTPADLRGWAIRAGLCEAVPAGNGEEGDHGEQLMIDARRLREAAHEMFLARIKGQAPPVSALVAIAGRVNKVSDGVSFASAGDISSCIASGNSDQSLLGVLSLKILDALFRLPPDRLGACPACGWMFYDVTRGGRRRWCSMATCGNRTKVHRHRGQRRANVVDQGGIDD